ncbi:alpha/beta fold hydrolase [Sciscionella sediminilitoris]|uniref:alpha/beta fold hydrolase n=1 Tax=Sciscionella sediminilitoris TaxID=1445613 RepID=UPI00068C9805|nr:alpha/beta hydrolase [Sciscionella sp. SE31]
MPTAYNGEIGLAYEVDPTAGEPILLLCGGFVQMIHWPEELLGGLRERGFQLARFDNRDNGRSTHCAEGPAYSLRDMAEDAVAVLDALGWFSAHILGISLGGMIGQVLAVHHPERVRSLCSVSSAPGAGLRISRPKLGKMFRILAMSAKKPKTTEGRIEHSIALYRLLTTPRYPVDEQRLRALFAEGEPEDPAGGMRNLAAMKASGDRRAELAGITAPTLVVHGDKDPMQSPKAGRATAEAIPGARLRLFPDVGHAFPAQLWPQVLDELDDLLGRAPHGSAEPTTGA